MPHPELDIPTPQPDTGEAVLVLNISGTIHADELPDPLHHLPAFNITGDCTPSNDVVSGPRVLQALAARPHVAPFGP